MTAKGTRRGRSDADDALAAALAGGAGPTKAAEALGLSVATVRRRLRSPAFARQVGRLRGQMVDAASGRLSEAMARAVGVLVGQLGHPDPGVAFRAAAKVIDSAVRVRDQVELEQRLAELERSVAPDPKGRP